MNTSFQRRSDVKIFLRLLVENLRQKCVDQEANKSFAVLFEGYLCPVPPVLQPTGYHIEVDSQVFKRVLTLEE